MSTQPGQIDPEIVKTVIGSYYSRGVEAADRARDRSERGYTIASAIAAALVAAGVFAKLSERPLLVQILGLVALALWLLTAAALHLGGGGSRRAKARSGLEQ